MTAIKSVDQAMSGSPGADRNIVIGADGETRTHKKQGNRVIAQVPAGGVSVALDRVSQQTRASFVTRARTPEDSAVLDKNNNVVIRGRLGSYTMKRIAISQAELDDYYYGFSNQSLWPLFHSAVDRMVAAETWYRGYVEVNRRFAEAMQAEIRGQTLVWVNDYQLALVPSLLERGPDVTVSLFWHIPWPVPDIFRRLPQREAMLHSLVSCDLIGFHTEEYARNFLQAAELELGASIDLQNLTARLGDHQVRALALPLGIDTDAVRGAAEPETPRGRRRPAVPEAAENDTTPEGEEAVALTRTVQVLLGVDRLDYSKGITQRLMAVDRFFEKYAEYRGKAVYLGIMSPTREAIPAYQQLKQEIMDLEASINDKYRDGEWEPLCLCYEGLPRQDVPRLYAGAAVCLVTSLADGMNLVAKEFVIAASCVKTPGMLVLSEFAGASNDMQGAIIVNPHDVDAVADGIHAALEMPVRARRARISRMTRRLDRENIHAWAQTFMEEAVRGAETEVDRVA